MLFGSRAVGSAEDVREQVRRIVAGQKRGSPDDLSAFAGEIEELLAHAAFEPAWKKAPAVFRVAVTAGGAYTEGLVLPDVKHDLKLVLEMLNHMRGQKGLPAVKMPLFVQPDELALARPGVATAANISSQLAIIFQKGAIMWAGFVFGRDYVLLQG